MNAMFVDIGTIIAVAIDAILLRKHGLVAAAIVTALWLGVVGAGRASDNPAAPPSSCGELACRSNGLPFVTEAGGVTIMVGEAFSVELKIEGGKIIGVVPRKTAGDLPNSLELEFTGDGGPMLSVQSHVDQGVKYDAFMKLSNGRLVATSSCPVMPKMGAFETWADNIVYLELRNFRFVSESGVMVCQ